jgi:hypothetical protein
MAIASPSKSLSLSDPINEPIRIALVGISTVRSRGILLGQETGGMLFSCLLNYY